MSIPSYQHGNPHQLNPSLKPKEILLVAFSEVSSAPLSLDRSCTENPTSQADYVGWLKFLIGSS
jgi:hypothetical protein